MVSSIRVQSEKNKTFLAVFFPAKRARVLGPAWDVAEFEILHGGTAYSNIVQSGSPYNM
jgi:hypothetical protein